ncbi:MAG: hypothetical protein J5902_02000 [Paludibacteraceae bacterium]|nr:hypothetical protein [Paludibacteraceae bacterium]
MFYPMGILWIWYGYPMVRERKKHDNGTILGLPQFYPAGRENEWGRNGEGMERGQWEERGEKA